MDKKQTDKIAAFDTLYTTNHIQMLKILVPVVGKEFRHKLAIYIKYMEFQYALSLAKSSPLSFGLCSESGSSSVDFSEICDELFPFCTEKEQAMIQNLKNMQGALKQYKELEAAMSMMKELFPEGTNFSGNAGFSDMGGGFSPDILFNLLSPEQKDIFSMFQNKED